MPIFRSIFSFLVEEDAQKTHVSIVFCAPSLCDCFPSSSSPTDSAHLVYPEMDEDRILERCLVRIDVVPRLIGRCAIQLVKISVPIKKNTHK
jgi:hypothetical protein